MQAFNSLLLWLERVFIIVAGAMLLVIMMIATADVALRYIFNSPLGWSYDIISLYLMAGVFFFALSDTLEKNGHVAVDLLHASLTHRARHAVEIPGYLLVLPVLGAIAWLAFSRAVEDYRGGDVIAGRCGWPTWISVAFAASGFTLMTLRVIYRLVGHTASAVTGQSLICLPPLAGREDI